MKKAFMILFCMILAMSFLTLTGCGGSSDSGEGEAPAADSAYIGTWEVVSASFADEEAEAEDLPHFILEVREDGTAAITDDEGNVSEGKWKEIDGGIKVKGDDINMKFMDKEGSLECKVIGVHMILEKQVAVE